MNIGPGIHKWYIIAPEKVAEVFKGAASHGCNTSIRGSFVPPKSWLKKNNIMVMKIVQKPGDIVWVPAGYLHWTKASVSNFYSTEVNLFSLEKHCLDFINWCHCSSQCAFLLEGPRGD